MGWTKPAVSAEKTGDVNTVNGSPVTSVTIKPAESVNLSGAINFALVNNRTVENAQKSIRQAEYQLSSVIRERLPKIYTEYSYMRLSKFYLVPGMEESLFPQDNYFWSSSLSMPLYTGGSQELSEEIYRLGIDSERVKFVQTKNELVAQVKTYYFNVLRNMKYLEFLEQNLESLRNHEKITREFYGQGIVAKNSLLQSEVAVANAYQEVSTARRNLDISVSALNILMGIGIESRTMVTDVLKKTPFCLSYSDCTEQARGGNPELLIYAISIRQAEKSVALEKSGYIPKVGLQASYYQFGDTPAINGYRGAGSIYPDYFYTYMLKIQWNLFDWGQKSQMARSKQVEVEKLINHEKLARDQIFLRIKELHSHVGTAGDNIDVARLALEQARENLRIVNVRYDMQVNSSQEVLDAMADLRKAQSNYYNSLYIYNVSIAHLEKEMGVDIEKIIKREVENEK